MRNILHTAVAVAAATALLLTPVADASSLSSSRTVVPAPSEPTDPTDPTDPADPSDPTDPADPADPTDPDEDRPGAEVVSEVEKALVAAGHEVDPKLTAIAQKLADDWTGKVTLKSLGPEVVAAGYTAASSRGYMGPDGLEHHIEEWQEGHPDLGKIKGRNVGVAFSTEQDDRGWDQLWIVWAREKI